MSTTEEIVKNMHVVGAEHPSIFTRALQHFKARRENGADLLIRKKAPSLGEGLEHYTYELVSTSKSRFVVAVDDFNHVVRFVWAVDKGEFYFEKTFLCYNVGDAQALAEEFLYLAHNFHLLTFASAGDTV